MICHNKTLRSPSGRANASQSSSEQTAASQSLSLKHDELISKVDALYLTVHELSPHSSLVKHYPNASHTSRYAHHDCITCQTCATHIFIRQSSSHTRHDESQLLPLFQWPQTLSHYSTWKHMVSKVIHHFH